MPEMNFKVTKHTWTGTASISSLPNGITVHKLFNLLINLSENEQSKEKVAYTRCQHQGRNINGTEDSIQNNR